MEYGVDVVPLIVVTTVDVKLDVKVTVEFDSVPEEEIKDDGAVLVSEEVTAAVDDDPEYEKSVLAEVTVD